MLQKQINKYFGTKQSTIARQVEISKSHDRRGDHRRYRRSRSVIRHHHHHSPGHSIRMSHALSRSERNPSVSHGRRRRRRPKPDILQGEIRKLKPTSFDGDHRKEEDVEAWLLGMRKYF
jgi:hypothetical protein